MRRPLQRIPSAAVRRAQLRSAQLRTGSAALRQAYQRELAVIVAMIRAEFRAADFAARDAATTRDADEWIGAVREWFQRVRLRLSSVVPRPRPGVAAAVQLIDEGTEFQLKGLGLQSIVGGAAVESAIQRSVRLITDLHGTALRDIETVMLRGVAGGAAAETIAERLSEAVGVSHRKAEFWAVDQSLKLHAELTKERMVRAGVKRYIWTTSQDERVRDEHVELDGTVQEWDSPPVAAANGDRAHPGEYYRCRCQAYPVLEDM